MKIFWSIIGVIVALSVIFGLIGLGAGWFNKAVETVSPEHVQGQYDLVIRDWNALTTTADNACEAQTQSSADPNNPTLVESPQLAYAATYRNIRQAYNSAWQNIFDAKLVGPAGYPRNIPNYTEATGATPNFCSVSTALATLQNNS